jgi:hypothetical protein
MAGYETAFIVVRKDWWNSAGVALILHSGSQSESTSDTHLIIAPIRDTNDPHGVWLKHIPTTYERQDGAVVTMDFLVPWFAVVALGVVPESEKATAVGFAANSSTSVLGS